MAKLAETIVQISVTTSDLRQECINSIILVGSADSVNEVGRIHHKDIIIKSLPELVFCRCTAHILLNIGLKRHHKIVSYYVSAQKVTHKLVGTTKYNKDSINTKNDSKLH